MNIKDIRAHVAKQRTLLAQYEALEAALVEVDSLLGRKGDLGREIEAEEAKLVAVKESILAEEATLSNLKKEIAATVDRAQKIKQGCTDLDLELKRLQEERGQAIVDGTRQVKEGIEAAVSEFQAKARETITQIDQQIRDRIARKDALETEIDQMLGRVAALKEPTRG